jgi:hypothetical protein
MRRRRRGGSLESSRAQARHCPAQRRDSLERGRSGQRKQQDRAWRKCAQDLGCARRDNPRRAALRNDGHHDRPKRKGPQDALRRSLVHEHHRFFVAALEIAKVAAVDVVRTQAFAHDLRRRISHVHGRRSAARDEHIVVAGKSQPGFLAGQRGRGFAAAARASDQNAAFTRADCGAVQQRPAARKHPPLQQVPQRGREFVVRQRSRIAQPAVSAPSRCVRTRKGRRRRAEKTPELGRGERTEPACLRGPSMRYRGVGKRQPVAHPVEDKDLERDGVSVVARPHRG